MSNNNSNINIKISSSFLTLLTILFIGLKLTNYINWSWWWVLAPIWIPISIALIGILTIFILYIIFN